LRELVSGLHGPFGEALGEVGHLGREGGREGGGEGGGLVRVWACTSLCPDCRDHSVRRLKSSVT
jgi:hypothetical protein